MRTIIFIRHAKSSWDHDVEDKDRPLNERGVNDANLVASEAAKKLPIPDAVFSSPANRALTTCNIFMERLQLPTEKLTISPDLYDFGGSSVQQFITQLDNALETVILFGHNYAFTSLVNLYGDKYIENLPTAGIVGINFNVSNWKEIDKGTVFFKLTPKELK